MRYTIDVHTDHPLADMTVTNMAQKIAEELDFDGTHTFSVTVKRADTVIASWAPDPEES